MRSTSVVRGALWWLKGNSVKVGKVRVFVSSSISHQAVQAPLCAFSCDCKFAALKEVRPSREKLTHCFRSHASKPPLNMNIQPKKGFQSQKAPKPDDHLWCRKPRQVPSLYVGACLGRCLGIVAAWGNGYLHFAQRVHPGA